MKFTKIACVALVGAMAFALAGCAGNGTSESKNTETVSISALDASGNTTEVSVPKNPARVATLDMAALDIIDNLGYGDSVVGTSNVMLDYLSKYEEDSNVAKLGTVKEADLEAVASAQPDVIFIGGRLAASYDALSEIAPVVYLATDADKGVVQSTRSNAEQVAKIFGAEDKVSSLFTNFDGRIAALKDAAANKSAVIGIATSGSFSLLGNNARCSLIANELGFNNIGAEAAATMSGNKGGANANSNPHGNEASFETLVGLNPEYIFVLDRDSAINTEGAKLAKDIMNNDLVNSTQAAQAGNLIIMDHPAAWYTAEGGITALEYMLSDIESQLLK